MLSGEIPGISRGADLGEATLALEPGSMRIEVAGYIARLALVLVEVVMLQLSRGCMLPSVLQLLTEPRTRISQVVKEDGETNGAGRSCS